MYKQLVLLLPLVLWCDEDFITHYEYGQMLYNNPRGVSCAQCHGKSGEGKVIVSFRGIHGKQALRGPDIRTASLEKMRRSINIYHPVMPRYYLTDKEVRTIYDFIQKTNEAYLGQRDTNRSQ